MKRRSLLLLSTAAVFSLLLVAAILPQVYASTISHNVNARSGNDNHFGNSNSHASVKNDNSVHINQNGGGGGAPRLAGNGNKNNGNNNHGNNNNHHNNNNDKNHHDKDKKVVKKDIDKDITKTVIIKNETQPVPDREVIVPQVINNNENNNSNTNENYSETIHEDHVVYVDRPVQEVASVQEHTVYPVQNVTTTPETGAEDLALLSLPGMGGLGLFLRKKLRI
jgi:hypothetical protein